MFPTIFRLRFKINSLKSSFYNIKNPMSKRNLSFLSNLKFYTGPTRKETDTIGEIEVPISCLWGAQTQR